MLLLLLLLLLLLSLLLFLCLVLFDCGYFVVVTLSSYLINICYVLTIRNYLLFKPKNLKSGLSPW